VRLALIQEAAEVAGEAFTEVLEDNLHPLAYQAAALLEEVMSATSRKM
jgi:hypothetical protein